MSMDLIVRIAPLDRADIPDLSPRIVRSVERSASMEPLSPAEDRAGLFDDVATPPPRIVATRAPLDDSAVEGILEAFAEKYHTQDDTLRRNYRNESFAFIVRVLDEAGALFDQPYPTHAPADGEAASRGPEGEVARYKLLSNDGFHVTRNEAARLAEKLRIFLARGPTVQHGGNVYVLRRDAADVEDRRTLAWLDDVAEFFVAASRHHGFEVW